MLIRDIVELENGRVRVDVVDQSGFVSSYECEVGGVARLMKDLRG